ncbi:Wzz/FepE/Etk N-terminal domain-containing protein [Pedobacter glucosidilyticus]|uniref:Wzz/FepE/Etk N-terminal domain-containing protein n=1 Tax=Pedobacter glucosidilyticus TaxID=1122941 RepID=UPI0026EE386C|nr:Wzz/FepE/Etk N-terminal domain-containing protein [Pedobacter glucosidilyticus]
MEKTIPQLNLLSVSSMMIRNRKHIMLITFIGLVIGLITSFIITPKYEAYTVFYIPANNSISKSVLGESNLEDFMEFGSEEQTDQVLEMLQADELKDKVIQKFNLLAHYDIKADEQYPLTKVRAQLTSNTKINRTDYLAIKIAVKDEDPKIAAEIANYMSFALDSMRTLMQQERAKQAFDILAYQYQKKQKQVDAILAQLSSIRAQGVFDYKAQSEVLSEAIIKAETQLKAEEARLKVYDLNRKDLPDTTYIKAKGRLEAARATLKSLQPTINTFSKLSGKYLNFEAVYEKEKEALTNLQLRYENAEVDLKKSAAQKFMIDKASVPEKSTYPNKLLVMLSMGLSAFLLACLGFLVKENSH